MTHIDYGIRFLTHPLPVSERTTLALDDGRSFRMGRENLILRFQMRNRPDFLMGDIVTFFIDGSHPVSLLYQRNEQVLQGAPVLYDGHVHPIDVFPALNEWIPVSITLSLRNGHVSVAYGDAALTQDSPALKGGSRVAIYFGRCSINEAGSYNEIPSVDIRDITLERDGRLLYQWDCAAHDGETMFDSISGKPATVQNATWLIDRYCSFTELAAHSIGAPLPSIAFDGNDRFYIVNGGQTVNFWSLQNRDFQRIPIATEQLLNIYPNHLLAFSDDSPDRQLLAWCPEENRFSYFDPESRTWSDEVFSRQPVHHILATTSWDGEHGLLYSFGGYGNFEYSNDLSICNPAKPEQSRTLSLEGIEPRNRAASCIVRDTLYIFGGDGSQSGDQYRGSRNYYDLYGIDLANLDVNKIWAIPSLPPEQAFLPGENLVWNPDQKEFYTLVDLDGWSLARLRKDQPGFEILSAPIGLPANQYATGNLWRNEAGNKLFAAIVSSAPGEDADIRFYEMGWPPLSRADCTSSGRKRQGLREMNSIGLICTILLVLIAAAALLARRSKRRSKNQIPATGTTSTVEAVGKAEFTSAFLGLLGDFQVLSADGENISEQFSPTMRSLLILLVLHSTADQNGITSSELHRLLWSYKQGPSNTNRNTYVSRLRNVLKQVGDVKIITKNDYWRIVLGDGVSCDFLEANRLLAAGESRDVHRLLAILKRGALLSRNHETWLEPLRLRFTEKVGKVLRERAAEETVPAEEALECLDTALLHNPVDEKALAMKVRALVSQGQGGKARMAYAEFCRQFTAVTGDSTYPRTFQELAGS